MPASLHIETEWRKAKTLALLKEYKLHPSIEIRNQLIKLNQGLIRKVAFSYADRCPEGYEDLAQIGVDGLIRAIEGFNLSKNAAFSSYAVPFIRGAILHWLRDKKSHLKSPRRWGEDYDRVHKIKRTMAARGREISEERIALSLGISEPQWRKITEANQYKPFESLDAIADLHQEDDAAEEERELQRERLMQEVAALPPEAGNCVFAKFFEGLSDEQIGKRFKMSAAQVGESIEQAIELIRNRLGGEYATDSCFERV